MSQVNFVDYRISDGVSYGFEGGPDWRTIKTPMRTTGIVRRNRGWMMPQHRYTADYTKLHADAFDDLVSMTYVTCGAWLAFRFRDVTTNNGFIAQDEVIGVGDGTDAPLQLVKTYIKGARHFTRIIRLPVNPVIRDEDDAIIPATVNPLTGIAIPTGTWPNGKVIRWSGEFDVPVSFQDDYNPISLDNPSLSSQRVVLIEEMAPLVALEPDP